jgi:hypothetical protein
MKTRILVLALLISLCSAALFAAGKQTIIEGTQKEVFTAALKAAQANWAVTFADRQAAMISFNTGTSLTSNGMECGVRFQAMDAGHVQVTVRTQKKNGQIIAWGVGDRIADKLFKALRNELAYARGTKVRPAVAEDEPAE